MSVVAAPFVWELRLGTPRRRIWPIRISIVVLMAPPAKMWQGCC